MAVKRYGVFLANPRNFYPASQAIKRFSQMAKACAEAKRLSDFYQKEHIVVSTFA